MKTCFLTLIALVGIVLAGIPGCTWPRGAARRHSFEVIDANDDDKITADEFCDHFFMSAFTIFDKDKDGKVRKEEWLALESYDGAERLFLKLDADKDEALDYKEFSTPKERRRTIRNMFRTFDKNNDGVLEEEELLRTR